MLKAKNIKAVQLDLTDGVKAVLVQDGDEWCTLRRFTCVAPEAFKGQILVVGPAEGGGGFFELFADNFGRLCEFPIFMASPGLAEVIKAINASTKGADAGDGSKAGA